MGTQYHITVVTQSAGIQVLSSILKHDVDSLLTKINQQMSTYIPHSEISQFNRYDKTEWFTVSKELAFVVSAARSVSEQTLGAFDVTVAPLVDLWGFGVSPQLTMPTDNEIQYALKNIGYQLLEARKKPPALRKLNKKLQLDLSAIAKGFAVDKVSELLKEKGYANFLVEIGGEIRNLGKNETGEPWRIGIETPDMKKDLRKTLLLSNNSLATSGDYRNYFIKDGIRYSHTLNPVTGKPITHKLASVTVLHKSAMLADAYATALLVMGEEKGRRFIGQQENKLRVNLIIKNKDTFQSWQNIDGIKIPQTQEKCKKWGGCVYFD